MDINIGDIVVLSDEQTIQDNLDNGVGLVNSELTVCRIRYYECSIGKSWEFFEFIDSDIVLVRVSIDEVSEWRVYFIPDDWTPGDRLDCVQLGQTWVFNTPEDEEAPYSDLIYTNEFQDGEGNTFSIKGGSLAGEGEGDLFMITEWVTEAPVDNPHILVLETGGVDNENGGFVTFYQGAIIEDHEVELFKRN